MAWTALNRPSPSELNRTTTHPLPERSLKQRLLSETDGIDGPLGERLAADARAPGTACLGPKVRTALAQASEQQGLPRTGARTTGRPSPRGGAGRLQRKDTLQVAFSSNSTAEAPGCIPASRGDASPDPAANRQRLSLLDTQQGDATRCISRSTCSSNPATQAGWRRTSNRHNSRRRRAWLTKPREAQAPFPHQLTYCACPLPNDQFSFFTSTRLMNTSSRRIPTAACRPSAMPRYNAFFCSSVRPSFQVIWMQMKSWCDPRPGSRGRGSACRARVPGRSGSDHFPAPHRAHGLVDGFADALQVVGGFTCEDRCGRAAWWHSRVDGHGNGLRLLAGRQGRRMEPSGSMRGMVPPRRAG